MKRIFLAFLLLCGVSHAGVIQSFKVDTSSTNLATTYSTAAQSLVVSGVYYSRYLCVFNGAQVTIAVNMESQSGTSAPTSPGTHNAYIAPNVLRCFDTRPEQGLYVYLRSDSGSTISTGIISGEVYDRVQVP